MVSGVTVASLAWMVPDTFIFVGQVAVLGLLLVGLSWQLDLWLYRWWTRPRTTLVDRRSSFWRVPPRAGESDAAAPDANPSTESMSPSARLSAPR